MATTSEQAGQDLITYVVASKAQTPPDSAIDAGTLHILDTIAAAISGQDLPAGQHAIKFLDAFAPSGTSTVWGSSWSTSAHLAALANGMAAHANETDDSYNPSKSHPGCSVVPATFAMAEQVDCTGLDLVRAVVLGYDVCGRVPRALWPKQVDDGRSRARSTHAAGGLFGAAAALASVLTFSARQTAHLFAYCTQQLSGARTFTTDPWHVEKAFLMAGMPAMNATLAAEFVQVGWPAGDDTFGRSPSLFDLGEEADPRELVSKLGSYYCVEDTKFKKYPVGSPNQSPIDALLTIMNQHGLAPSDVAGIELEMSPLRLHNIRNRPVPDVNVEYLLGICLDEGQLLFDAVHDESRFQTWWESGGTDPRIKIIPQESRGSSYGCTVRLITVAGDVLSHSVEHIPGSRENPMSVAQILEKARSLITPVLGESAAVSIVDTVLNLPNSEDVREVTSILARPS